MIFSDSFPPLNWLGAFSKYVSVVEAGGVDGYAWVSDQLLTQDGSSADVSIMTMGKMAYATARSACAPISS